MSSKDDFGNRMKEYEARETERRFLPMLPIYARIDGRSFSKFTKNMNRPFDIRMTKAMVETTRYLVKETNARIGFCQSDEISLVFFAEEYKSEVFFDSKIQKMNSILASMAASKFQNYIATQEDVEFRNYANLLPCFDCRIFQLPNKVEAANSILWRALDATKNSISMAAYNYYSHKELEGKTGSEKQEMLFQKGINFNDYPSFFKQGSFLQKRSVIRELSDEEYNSIPEKYRPASRMEQRTKILNIDMPVFSKVVNRVEVVFDGADPITE